MDTLKLVLGLNTLPATLVSGNPSAPTTAT